MAPFPKRRAVKRLVGGPSSLKLVELLNTSGPMSADDLARRLYPQHAEREKELNYRIGNFAFNGITDLRRMGVIRSVKLPSQGRGGRVMLHEVTPFGKGVLEEAKKQLSGEHATPAVRPGLFRRRSPRKRTPKAASAPSIELKVSNGTGTKQLTYHFDLVPRGEVPPGVLALARELYGSK